MAVLPKFRFIDGFATVAYRTNRLTIRCANLQEGLVVETGP